MTNSISIFANKFSQTVDFLTDVSMEFVQPVTVLGDDVNLLKKAKASESGILFFVGDLCEMKRLVAQTFELTMFIDQFALKNVEKYCKNTFKALPPQHILDKVSLLPDSFKNFEGKNSMQCSCYGEVNKRLIFIFPEELTETKYIYESYALNIMAKFVERQPSLVYKIFSLDKSSVLEKLASLDNSKYVSQRCETVDECDFRLRAVFKNSATKSIISAYDSQVKKIFGDFVYSNSDSSIQQEIVTVLLQMKKRVAVAESLTGGLISSKLVDISGASKVLYEGVVTYSSEAKTNRLRLNPLFIDTQGVVSGAVARGMAESLIKDKHAEFSLSTTGYADRPTSDDNLPVGLCFVGIGTIHSIKVYRFEFNGSRQQIRNQAANSALFLLLSTLKGKTISFD